MERDGVEYESRLALNVRMRRMILRGRVKSNQVPSNDSERAQREGGLWAEPGSNSSLALKGDLCLRWTSRS
jgi:hypothetical protein